MERRYHGGDVTLRAQDGGGTIDGLASVFYDGTPDTEYELWDGAVERIMPEAFDEALGQRGDDVRALFNHDPVQLLGRRSAGTLRLAKTDRGLSYSIDVADTNIGRDVVEHVRRRDVQGSSFAFVPTSVTWTQEGDTEVREINSVQLIDVGPVTFPAYEATTVTTKASGNHGAARDEYRAWKDAERAAASAAAKAKRDRHLALLALDGGAC